MPSFKDSEGYSFNSEGKRIRTITQTIHVGEVTLGSGEKLDVLTTWGQSPVVRFKDGCEVKWSWEELVNEAIKIKEQKQEPTSSAK